MTDGAQAQGELNEDVFRRDIQAFLQDKLPLEYHFRYHTIERSEKDIMKWWQRTLFDKGWGAPAWPQQFGGGGWSERQCTIFDEECARVGAPICSPFGLVMVGPVIYTFGSEAQKRQHLPSIIDGSVLWCQGYSEPGAGSDLASLDCRAVRDGDVYVVNGQKIWTTQAHWADWIFCLVRTDPEARPQAGISFLLIDMRSPGLEVRPIVTIDGRHHLNEVFLSDVRVPVENLVGEENQGWTYAKFLLANERQGIASVALARSELGRLRAFASSTEHFSEPPIRDPYYVRRIVELENRLEALAALEARALSTPAGSFEGMMLLAPLKLQGSHIQQDCAELFVEIAGPAALPQVGSDSLYGPMGAELMTSHLMGRTHTIYGGTSEVQKNVIAKLLGNA